MANLTSHYGGITLHNPIMASNSGLTVSLQRIKASAQAGVGAVIPKSLFEEQTGATAPQVETEVATPYPEGLDYALHYMRQHEVEKHLDLIHRARQAIDAPVIASVNCYRDGEWEAFAQSIQGADAGTLEFNVVHIETDPVQCSGDLEQEFVDPAISITRTIQIPVVFKVSGHSTNILCLAQGLVRSGVKGLTCFSKSWQTGTNIEALEIAQGPVISTGHELCSTLKYTRLLTGKLPQLTVSASGGAIGYAGVVRSLLVGANSVQVVPAFYQHGVSYLTKTPEELTQ